MKKKKILFLYTELAGYFLSCVQTLAEQFDVEVHIVRWQVNKEAPFDFKFHKHINIYERNSYTADSLITLVNSIQPDLIYCSGWIDKEYVKVARRFNPTIPVVVGIDNQWTGTFRQRLATLFFRFVYKNCFKYAWVSGSSQKTFAQKIGFANKNIFEGVYSADVTYFHSLYTNYKIKKESEFPKRFIYVGRYYDFKGIKELWNAFIRLQNELPNEWELWCLGTGDVDPVIHPKIKHFGFVQPNELQKYVEQCGVFILPSRFEPWGVVLHEFAAAGFPLLCSNKVGAANSFLMEGENGYILEANNESDILEKMKRIVGASDQELVKMGNKSVQISDSITPIKWSETLLKLCK